MASGATSQAISGAASGAATGAFFGPMGAVVGGGLGFVGGLISGSSADDQFNNQMAWANYNRQSQYNTDVYNIENSLAIAGMNAFLGISAAKMNANIIRQGALYNATIIDKTLEYNDALLENELVQTWNDLGLDVTQLEATRARERGFMIAEQGASGTVIGSGSNAVVVMDQMTQEAMDINILQFGAERQAADIENERAQGRWQGQVAIQQTLWEGEMAAFTTMYNANVQAAGSMATAGLNAAAGMYMAEQSYDTAGYNITQANDQNSMQNSQNLIGGLFNAGASATQGYYARKVPGTGGTSTTGGGSYTPMTYQGPLSPGYTNYGNTTPGNSLMTQVP